MSGSDIGNLADSIRMQVDQKTLRDGRQWAHDIVNSHARDNFRGGVYALKCARAVVDERKALERLKGGQNDIVDAR